MNKVIGLLVAGVVIGGIALVPRSVVQATTCLADCYDVCSTSADTDVADCEASCDPTDPAVYTTCISACAVLLDTSTCEDSCDTSCAASDAAASATTTTTTATTTASVPTGWTTIVPGDCQDKDGCDICEVSKIFTNAADLIAGAVSAVALLMFILGGLLWIFSGGVESRVETGKKILLGTVSGLALVFVAWFGVNIIVRTASLSGGSSTSKIFTGGTFSKEWWSFEGCYPVLPTTCKGLNIGAACATGQCSTNYKDPNCSCYRATSTGGDSAICEGDDSTTGITGTLDTTKKQCYCSSACTLFTMTTAGAGYGCELETTVTAANTATPGSYTLNSATCATTGTICVKPK